MPLWAHLSSSCYSSPFVLIVFRVLVRTEVFVWRWFPRLCFCDRPTKAYEITVSSCCTYQCFVCNPTSGNTCKRLTQTEFRGVCADVGGEVWVKPSHIFEIILNRSNWICSLSPAAVISQSTDVRWMCLWTSHWSECGSWRAVIGWSVCQQWARAYTSVRAQR